MLEDVGIQIKFRFKYFNEFNFGTNGGNIMIFSWSKNISI